MLVFGANLVKFVQKMFAFSPILKSDKKNVCILQEVDVVSKFQPSLWRRKAENLDTNL